MERTSHAWDTEGAVELPDIYSMLYSLGASANYTGFFHTSYAVMLAVQDPQRLLLVTKWLYPDVARHYKTSWKAVERNIRTIVSMIWGTNPGLLSDIAGYKLNDKPGTARFLAIVSAFFSNNRAA